MIRKEEEKEEKENKCKDKLILMKCLNKFFLRLWEIRYNYPLTFLMRHGISLW